MVGCVCRLLVKQYVPEIMKAVVALPEQQVCGAIGLCSSSSMSGARSCAAAMHPVLPKLLPGTLLPCCLATALTGITDLQLGIPAASHCCYRRCACVMQRGRQLQGGFCRTRKLEL